MKYLLNSFFCLGLIVVLNASAQAQNAIAKIKYEQAEEAYTKGDFSTAVVKLDEAEKLLGSTNPKIMYLRIMSQDKLLDGDSSIVDPLRKNCQYYLKEYEKLENLEEKYKDVYLVSERLLQYEKNPDFIAGEQAYKAKDYSAALQHFRKAAASGFARAMTYIGIMNLYGNGMDRNMEEARKWFERSAEKGNGFGYYWLGEVYYFGWGVTTNIHQSLQYYQQAASKNVAPAFTGLGNIYYFNLYDPKKAFEWYQKGAAKNDGYAQFMLADYFLKGTSVPKDEAAALSWYKKAINNGYPQAMTMIGYIYLNGYGVPKDYTQAYEWYSKGAEKGIFKCMLGLSVLYEEGWGVKKDKKLAQEWRNKAAAAKGK